MTSRPRNPGTRSVDCGRIVVVGAFVVALSTGSSALADGLASLGAAGSPAPLAISVPATRFSAIDFSLVPGVLGAGESSAGQAEAGAKPSGAGGASGTGAAGKVDGTGAGAAPSSAAGIADGGAATTTTGPTVDAVPSDAPRSRRFGERGQMTFNVYGDWATDFEADWLAGAQLGMSWFFVDNLSLDVQLEQYAIIQEGANAYAVGPALLLRWHFLARETWSVYTDFGCGFIWSTESVPSNGSDFNFTPRIGIGGSFEVVDNLRVMTGIRWFHISNANTSTPNPGRDSLELYAGISIPF